MNSFSKTDLQKILIVIILIVFFLTMSLSFYYPMFKALAIVSIGIGSIFLPGFFLTLLFLPLKKNLDQDTHEHRKSLDSIERVVLSVFLSIVLNTIIFMSLQMFKIVITTSVLVLVIIIVNILTGLAIAIAVRKSSVSAKN